MEKIQTDYYTKTALFYDDKHVHQDDEHYKALSYISSFVESLNISSILDVGCGTGRGVEYFLKRHSNVRVIGVEPSQSLICIAIDKRKISPNLIISGDGELLPFKNNSFDAVSEFGVLHHVKKPNIIVSEMIRVARKAVFLSDSNRFGQGIMFIRFAKLILYKLNVWGLVNFIKTKGKGYIFSEGDGISYSYSVFDSYKMFTKWADKIVFIPTSKEKSKSWHSPLLTSSHALLCAIKETL